MKLGTRELYQPIQSCYIVCLGISNKSVAVPRQDSIRTCRAHAILTSGYCNILYLHYECIYPYIVCVNAPQVAAGAKFEEEIKTEQEKKKKEAEEAAIRKTAFKEKASMWH